MNLYKQAKTSSPKTRLALHTHTHTHTLIFNRNKIKKRFEHAFALAKTCLKTLARDFFALERGADGAGANEEFDPSYITAKHGEDARLGQMRGQKPAFTLAEVLITLAVIGIVAALTIGIFLPKIHSTIRARQIATAEVKCLEIPSGSGLVTPFQNSF